MFSKKVQVLFDNLRKTRKDDIKFIDNLNKLEDEYGILLSERIERIAIFSVSWVFSVLLIITATVLGQEASTIAGSVSGVEQGGTFNFRPDIYGFGVLFFAAPFFYMIIRKFKGNKE